VKDVSREYGIPRRNLLRWRKNGCERKEGGGRPTDTEMECILYDKIKNGQIKGEK
jgi:transposase-like protein